MPFRPSMAALLRGRRLADQLEAMNVIGEARRVREAANDRAAADERRARESCRPSPAPVDTQLREDHE